jgi:trigger factor
MKAKEDGEVELSFPEDFNVKELAGHKAKMSLTITDVRKAKLPKVDEEFVKSFGVESGDVEEFKSDIRKNLERELKQSVSNAFRNKALEELRDACSETLVPLSMITRESEQMARQEQQRAAQMGIENAPMPDATQFEEGAKNRILNTLIIQDIAQKQDIKTDFAKVREQINEIAQTFEQPEEVVQMYYKNPDLMAGIEQNVVETQVMEWLEGQVSIKEKKQSFDDIMKPQA